jgi:hypothetical protein
MSDGYATNSQHYMSFRVGDKITQRSMKFRAEWLAEKILYKTMDPFGQRLAAIQHKPPRLMRGKTGWHVFAATLEDKFLRRELPSNILVNLFLQDGLHLLSMQRRSEARHELYYDLQACDPDDYILHNKRMMDWVLGWRCTLHKASSGVQWGLSPWTTEDILSDAHICILACRNSSEALHLIIPTFIDTKVCYAALDSRLDERRQFWEMLHIPKAFLDAILEVNPIWDFDLQLLYVNQALQHDAQGRQELRTPCIIF